MRGKGFMKHQTSDRLAIMTIATSALISAEANLTGLKAVGLVIPTIVTGDITFQVSNESGGTFQVLKSAAGSALTITAGTGNFSVDSESLKELVGWKFVKVVTAGTQTGTTKTFRFVGIS